MTTRTFAQYSDHKILEHCRGITLDDLLSRSITIIDSQLKTLSNAINTAVAHGCAAHLIEWPDGVLACVVSTQSYSFSDLVPTIKIAAYRRASTGIDFIYRDLEINCGGEYA